MRATATHLTVLLLIMAMAAAAIAAPQVRTVKPRATTVQFEDPLTALSPLEVSQQFDATLKAKGIKAKDRSNALDKFRKLPAELQSNLLMTVNDDYAKAGHHYDLSISHLDPSVLSRIREFRLFRISSIWPAQGSPGGWAYAFGSGFGENCEVLFDGNPVDSHYLGMDFEFFPNSMAFDIPEGAALAQEHQIRVRNTDNDTETADYQYEIVAPRSYRGYHGWKFANFSRPSIDWKLYAHYFGASNVEYADGTHRPAAQTFYDDAYSGAGGGGNCYGMSVSSLRVRNHEFDHMFHASHFQNDPTAEPWCWWYDWNDTTRETVQQQQGSWFTQEVLDVYNDLWNNQSPRELFNRCQSLMGNVTNRPVLVYWGQTAGGNWWGHAVCPYDTEVDGNTRRIICYDNNNPYAEDETGAVDPDVATVDWGANTFSRGSAFKAQLMSYNECTPANPHLPGAEYGGPGSDAVVVVASANTELQQITDENGRTFYNADGSINENPDTRIPLSSLVPPLVQVAPRVLQRPRIGQLQIQLPDLDRFAAVYVIGDPGGKSLTFDIAGEGAKSLALFSAGRIFSIDSSGIGQIRFSDIHQTPAVEILNAQAVGPTSVEFIRSTAAGDRVFEITNLRNLGVQQLELVPNAEGTAIEVNGPANLQFNLDVLGPVGQGMQQATFGDIALQAGAAANLSPLNWGALQNTTLKLQMLNLQNRNVIDQQTIQRLR